MQKLHTSIFIRAPKEKVWDTMLNADTYREWTKAFNPTPNTQGSFRGDWSEGSKMLFIGMEEDGKSESGMVSRIAKNRPYEFLSIEHLGILENGVEDLTSETAKKWAPAFENYTLVEKNDGTELIIDQDVDPEYIEQFKDTWDEALEKLKELAEKA